MVSFRFSTWTSVILDKQPYQIRNTWFVNNVALCYVVAIVSSIQNTQIWKKLRVIM